MAIYNIGCLLREYNPDTIRKAFNNSKDNDLLDFTCKYIENKLQNETGFLGKIIYYDFDYDKVEDIYYHTNRKTYEKEINYCLDNDFPFANKLLFDKEKDFRIQKERNLGGL